MAARIVVAAALLVACSAAMTRAAQPAADSSSDRVQVTTESGVVRGVRFGELAAQWMFLGIPYAAAPTGLRRWAPPAAVEAWNKPRDAGAFGASCPQKREQADHYAAVLKDYGALPGFGYFAPFRMSEDCLFLNVWSTAVGSDVLRPVIVWIHGGANKEGTGQLPLLGPAFANRGVVVVTINYRLGLFGFLAHPALTAESSHGASGNYGILDQIAALQWVQHNIKGFGGDPGNVTVMGESAGGTDVCHLMAAPLARGLFRRAIVESNSCADYLMPERSRSIAWNGGNESAEAVGLRLARRLRVGRGARALDRLRAKSADELLNAFYSSKSIGSMGSIIDGYVIPEQPAAVFAAGRQAAVALLIGSNANEGSMFTADEAPKTVSGYKAWLEKDLHRDWKLVFDRYPAKRDADVAATWEAMDTDYAFGASAYVLARAMHRIHQPVYYYYFTYPAKGRYAAGGAYHSLELVFLQNVFRPSSWGDADDSDRKLASSLADYWTRFAANADPNGPGLPIWPRYDPETNQVLELGHEIRTVPMPHGDRYELFARIIAKKVTELDAARGSR